MSKLSLKQKFSLIQMTYWCSICAMFVFISAYLYNLGFSATFVGIALALQKVFGLVGQLLWTSISKTKKDLKRNFILGNGLLLIVFVLAFIMRLPMMVIFFIGLSGFFEAAMPTLLDTWILKSFYKNPEVYGSIRSAASFAFAWFALFLGKMIDGFGFIVMPVGALVLVMITIGLSISIHSESEPIENNTKDSTRSLTRVKLLLSDKNYTSILLTVFLFGICSLPFTLCLPILLRQLGGSIEYVGYASFASAISQVPMMFLYLKYKKFNPYLLISLAILLNILGYWICLISTQPIHIVFAQILLGLGFGILLPTLRNLVFLLSNNSNATIAQGLVDIMQISLAGILGNILIGFITDRYGVQAVIYILILLLIFAEFVILYRYSKNKKGEDSYAIK